MQHRINKSVFEEMKVRNLFLPPANLCLNYSARKKKKVKITRNKNSINQKNYEVFKKNNFGEKLVS